MDDVFVYLVDMPNKVKAVTVPCEDCDYTVYLNSRLTYEMRETAFFHELEHIRRNDFDNEHDVNDLELKRNT